MSDHIYFIGQAPDCTLFRRVILTTILYHCTAPSPALYFILVGHFTVITPALMSEKKVLRYFCFFFCANEPPYFTPVIKFSFKK